MNRRYDYVEEERLLARAGGMFDSGLAAVILGIVMIIAAVFGGWEYMGDVGVGLCIAGDLSVIWSIIASSKVLNHARSRK